MLAALCGILTGACVACRPAPVPSPVIESGPGMVKATCTRCHTADVVKAQRLTRGEWDVELTKMTKMGAQIQNRAALLDYLTAAYGPEK